MRTAEEIEKRIKDTIESMLKRPMMFVDSPLGLESMVLGHIELLRFVRSLEADRVVIDAWRRFAREKVGYETAKPVSRWMNDEGKLGEDWKGLTQLLGEFVEAEEVVWRLKETNGRSGAVI